jgi:predicted TPR repeat methyltransferase
MSNTQTQADPIVARLHVISDLISKGSHAEAATELNTTHKLYPTDPRPLLLGARSAEAVGNMSGAIELVQRAVQLTPQWSVAATELAMLLGRSLQVEDAMKQASVAVALDPANLDVLYRVIDLAHRVHQPKLALEWLDRAVVLAPDNPNLRFMRARDHHVIGNYDQAVALYSEILASNPGEVSALLGRTLAAVASNQLELAVSDTNALVALEPTNSLFVYWSEVANGRTPSVMPNDAVLAQFDTGRADLYEKYAEASGYVLPKLTAEWIRNRYPDLKLNLLDLGCGTGLVAAKLGRVNGAIVGVDLSMQMVEQAVRHNVYDKIHTVNVLDALKATPSSLYNVLTACELFPYLGDLTSAVSDAFRLIVPGGHFIFSCEESPDSGADLALNIGLRYRHKLSHVKSLCLAAGFVIEEIKPLTLLAENGQSAAGFAVIAHKPA